MNRHLRIFWGIFFWIAVAVCAFLAIANAMTTPVNRTSALIFAGVGVVSLVGGVLMIRDRRRV